MLVMVVDVPNDQYNKGGHNKSTSHGVFLIPIARRHNILLAFFSKQVLGMNSYDLWLECAW